MQFELQHEPQPSKSLSVSSLPQEATLAQEEASALSIAEKAHPKANVRAVIDHLRQSAYRRKKARLGISLFLCLCGVAAAACSDFLMRPYLTVFSLIFSAFVVMMNVVILPAIARRTDARSRNALETLNDIGMTGLLLQTYAAEQSTSQPHLAAALRRLLPRLQASDANLLNREQRAALYQVIGTSRLNTVLYDKTLVLAGLQALRHIGDKEALPVVLKLSRSTDEEIRDVANKCLGPLMELSEQYKRGEQYLRPSSVSAVWTDQADVLVRPASASTEQTAPEQLLRASKNQE